VDGLFVHPKKWTVCHTVTFQPTLILANPWLWHFVHFGFWFLLSIPCQSYSWFWQMTTLWHYPFNFFASTDWFRRPRANRGYSQGVFFDYFSNWTARLEATATSSLFPRDDFDHCDILPPPMKQAQRLPGGPRWPVTKHPHFSLEQKWNPCHNPGKKKVDILLQWQNVLILGGVGC
jgi:hypothetical protein